MEVRIHPSWKERLTNEFDSFYFEILTDFVRKEYKDTIVYPPAKLIFNAFDSCPFDQVRVVLLGQDPYHEAGQAMGLSFSVPPGTTPPPSLRNIFKEIQSDLGSSSQIIGGDLSPWTKQGILLLNSTLTVRQGQAASHQGHGWETFTDAVIQRLSKEKKGIVFLLWGRYAINKSALIDRTKHFILTAPHPSPLSASRGFFGCKHFSKTNEFLIQMGQSPINW